MFSPFASSRSFPDGAPESERAAAFTFAALLDAQGYPAHVLSLVTDETSLPRVWVLAERYHIEPTIIRAENRLPAVSMTRPRAHEGTIPTRMSELENERERAQVEQDTAVLLPLMERPVPERRFQPWREVVDTWEQAHVLSCGHLRTPSNNYTSVLHQRRCPWCEPDLPAKVYRVVGNDEDLTWFARLSDHERGQFIRQGRLAKLEQAKAEFGKD